MLIVGSFGWKGIIEVSGITLNSVMEVVESILWSVSKWVSTRREFNGVSMKDLYRSWSSFFKGGWRVKSRVRVAWMNPSAGVLKLNFDGSFVRSL